MKRQTAHYHLNGDDKWFAFNPESILRGGGRGAEMKRKVPTYVERAILRIENDYDMLREIERLMPFAAYRVGAGLMNAHYAREDKNKTALNRRDAARKLAHSGKGG